jgi:hypothetical protein
MLVMSCNFAEKLSSQITPQEAQEVKNICNNIKPHPSFTKKDEVDTVKPNLALRSTRYSSTEPPEEIEKYFVNLLNNSRWAYHKEYGGNSNTLIFKKDKFTINIVIETSNYLTSNKTHFIDCSIGIF